MSRSRRSVVPVCYKEQDSLLEDDNIVNNGDSSDDNAVLSEHLRDRLNLETPKKKVGHKKRSDDTDTPSKVLDEDFSISPKTTPRRGRRPRKQTAFATSHINPKDPPSALDQPDDTDEDVETVTDKPTSLFTEDDIEGKKLFGFKMSHKKQDLLRKAIEVAMESPKTPKKDHKSSNPHTPKSRKSLQLTPKSKVTNHRNSPLNKELFTTKGDKTPHRFRAKLKKEIQSMVDNSDDDGDFSDEGSSYSPSEDTDEDECDSISDGSKSSSGNDSGAESEEEYVPTRKEKSIANPYALRNTRGKDSNFIMKSDDYFTMQGSKKIVTSNHTLERLKNPRLTEDKLQNILKDQTLTPEHRVALKTIMEDYQRLYDKWMFILSEGFSIILHGVGSKENLIKDFQKTKLKSYPCMVINGFFPSLTLKDILDCIITDMLEMATTPSNVYEAVELIQNEMSTNLANHNIFLLVHNIDGAMLRNGKAQYVLSKLAKIRNVHLIATIDNINAPLIWDHKKLSDYNFSWWDATTYLPYTHETSYENSLLVHKSGALALSSLKNVFNSLTSNARGIFMLIVKNQLKNRKTAHFQGISFKDLYQSARESFFVSSDLALRAQLTEFLDHKLVRNKRTIDGTENLIIPIENSLLQQFSEQYEAE